MQPKYRLSNEDFAYIYSKVPRFNVDLIIRNEEGGVVLIKRSIEPHIGSWHLPGGTLYKGETIHDASVRVAKAETGFDTKVVRQHGFMEFPEEKRGDLLVHTVTVVLELQITGGELRKDENAKEIGIFTTLPNPGILEHYTFLKEHKILE